MPVQPRAVRRRKPLGSKPRTNLPPRSAFGPRRFAYAGRSSPGVLVPGVPTTRCVLRERQIDLPRQCPRQGNAAWPLDHQATEPTRNLPHLKYPRSTEPSDVLAAAGSCLPTREGTYERVAQPTPVIARLPASMGECPRWPAHIRARRTVRRFRRKSSLSLRRGLCASVASVGASPSWHG